MMKRLLLLPLLFLAIGVSAEVPAPPEINTALKSLVDGKARNVVLENKAADWQEADYYIYSFETPTICRSFELSEAEVREFFKHAQVLTDASRETVKKGQSRCMVRGSAEIPDGRKIAWGIDRARNGTLYFPDGTGQGLEFFCDKCQNSKFEPMESDSRPVIKSLVILENCVQIIDTDDSSDPDICKHFKMTEQEIRDFFKTARASVPPDFYSRYTTGACHVNGEATLQDGEKVSWSINESASATIHFPEDGTLWFFCDTCSAEKFPAICLEGDCMSCGAP
jgi:hypothetical protein